MAVDHERVLVQVACRCAAAGFIRFFVLPFSLHMSDLLLALRSLARTPAFTAVVVLVLALGIGANTAIFSVVDAALLKPMPIPDAHRVVRLAASHPQSFVWFNPRGFEVWP